MPLTDTTKTDLYRFAVLAFDAAPGVTYLAEMGAAIERGASVKQLIGEYTKLKEFTDVYHPVIDSNATFASKFVNNNVAAGTDAAAVAKVIADITASLNAGQKTRADVIYDAMKALEGLENDAVWGATAKQLSNSVAYAQYYTETLRGGSEARPTLESLRAVVATVTASTPVDAVSIAAVLNPGSNIYALTNGIDVAERNKFVSVPVYTPDGGDFINSLQDEDVLTGVGIKPTLSVTLGSTNDAAETLPSPKMSNIEEVIVQVNSNSGRAGIGFQDASGLKTLTLDRVTAILPAAGTSQANFLDLPATTTTVNLNNATRAGVINVTYREDALIGDGVSRPAESLAVAMNSVRAQAVNITEGTDGGTDNGFFFENIKLTTNGGVDVDALQIQQNGQEDVVEKRAADTTKQTIDLTVASGSAEFNTFTATGADTLKIDAVGPLVVAGDPNGQIQTTGGTGLVAGDLETIEIKGAGDVRLDAVEMQGQPAAPASAVARTINGASMSGQLRLGVEAATAADAQLSITSGSGKDEIRFGGDVGATVTTGGGNDTVGGGAGFVTPALNPTASVSTGAGDDTITVGAMGAVGDAAGTSSNNNAVDTASRLNSGEGNDIVIVGALAGAITWNDGVLTDSNADDTFVAIGASVSTGDGNDTVTASTVAEGASLSTGAGNDTLTVELPAVGDMLAADTNPDVVTIGAAGTREVTAANATIADRLGGLVSTGEGDDTINYRDNAGSFTAGVVPALNTDVAGAVTIVGRDAQLDAGAGTDVLNVTATDLVTVAAITTGVPAGTANDLNATILGVETINLTIVNQVVDDGGISRTVNETLGNATVNDGLDTDGAISLDVNRVDAALGSVPNSGINLISQEQAMATGAAAGAENYAAGTATAFTLQNYRSAVALTLTANEATGVVAGVLTDDNQFAINTTTWVATNTAAATDVFLTLDVNNGELTNNTVTLTVNSGTAEQATNGGMDLDITLNATTTDTVAAADSTTDDNAARVENLAIVLNDARDHSIDLNGFGDVPFRATAAPAVAGDVSSTAATSLQVWSGAAAVRRITVDEVSADSIAFRNADGTAVTAANVVVRVSASNNYNVATGSGTDVIDMRADDVRSDDSLTGVSRADTISAGTGRDTMIVSNGDSIGANNNIPGAASAIIDDDVFGAMTSLERIVTDADSGAVAAQMITLDEMARATGVDTLQFVSTVAGVGAVQTSNIVIGNNFSVAAGNGNGELTDGSDALIIDAARHTGGVTTLNIENKDDDTDTDLVNLDIRASATRGASINLFNSGSENSTVEMRITTTGTAGLSNVVSNTGVAADGVAVITVGTGSFDKLVLLEGAAAGAAEAAAGDTVTIAANWTRNNTTNTADNKFTLDASALADTDSNAATGGLTVTVGLDGAGAADTAALTILTGANSDNITASNQADVITSGAGNDTVAGGSGADTIDAGAGNDTVNGGAGNDSISGGAGNDTIFGGLGADTLRGDGGDDQFHLTAVDQSVQSTADTLADFLSGTDKVVVTLSPAAGVINLGRFAEVNNVGEGDNSLDGTVGAPRLLDGYFSTGTGTGQLAIDVDGNGDITDVSDIVVNVAEVSLTQRIKAGDINYNLTLGGASTVRLGQGVDNIVATTGGNTFVVVGSLSAAKVAQYTAAGAAVVTNTNVVQYNDLLTPREVSEANAGDVINASAGIGDTLDVYGAADFTNVSLLGIENVVVHSDVTFTLAQFLSISAITFQGNTTHSLKVVIPGVPAGVNTPAQPQVQLTTAQIASIINGTPVSITQGSQTVTATPTAAKTLTVASGSIALGVTTTGAEVTPVSSGSSTLASSLGVSSAVVTYNGLVVDAANLAFANGLTNFTAGTFVANITGMTGAQLGTITGGAAAGRYGSVTGTYTWDASVGTSILTALASSNSVTAISGTASGDTINLSALSKGYTVTPGAGNDVVTLSSGKDTVILGGASDGSDTVVISGAATTTKTGTNWGVANADVITGFSANDFLTFGFTATAVATTAALVAGTTIGYIRGNFNATSGVFTESVSGADTLVLFDKDGIGSGTDLGGVVLTGTALTTGATGVTGVSGG